AQAFWHGDWAQGVRISRFRTLENWHGYCEKRLVTSTRSLLMSLFSDPFDPDARLVRSGCSCGRHADAAEHERGVAAGSIDERVVQATVMRALFPQDSVRRNFLKAVGIGTALAAISTLFPLAAAREAFASAGPLEKTHVRVGFVPITCATPIIMAH